LSAAMRMQIRERGNARGKKWGKRWSYPGLTCQTSNRRGGGPPKLSPATKKKKTEKGREKRVLKLWIM